jgi:hypothetical protein
MLDVIWRLPVWNEKIRGYLASCTLQFWSNYYEWSYFDIQNVWFSYTVYYIDFQTFWYIIFLICIFHSTSNDSVKFSSGHAGSIKCVYLNGEEKYVLSGSYDTSIRYFWLFIISQ